MKASEIIKETRGVFLSPVKKYYLGKLKYGTPYFYPMGFNETVISFRRLIEKTREEIEQENKQWPHFKDKLDRKFKNLPMVRRSKDWIFKLFNTYYWLQVGWPISICSGHLGWKDKFESPRHEWSPAFYIFFFKWQFAIHWVAPIEGDDHKYYEMILWYLKYSDKDLKKAEDTWGWVRTLKDGTKISTWNKDYLIK